MRQQFVLAVLVLATLVAVPVTADATGPGLRQIRYLSTSAQGRPIMVTGVALFPKDPPPPGGWPVISWAHGTTGLSDQCAPSRRADLGGHGYAEYVAKFVRAGFVVVATDYEGLGTPGMHPYLIAESQARSVVDAVHAVRSMDRRVSRVWLTVGHSQGGHAAMAAGEIAGDRGRGLDFRGTVALAPITDNRSYVDQLARLAPVDHGYFMAVLAGLHTRYPELRFADHLGPRALRELPGIYTSCLDEVTDKMIRLNLPGAEFTPRTATAARRLTSWLGDNAVPRARSAAPMLIARGTADFLVPAEKTEVAAARARTLGTNVTYTPYEGVGHADITEASLADVLRWIRGRVR